MKKQPLWKGIQMRADHPETYVANEASAIWAMSNSQTVRPSTELPRQ
jgi:hypothetical protein